MSTAQLPSPLNLDSLETRGWQVFDDFFATSTCQFFLDEILKLEHQNQFKSAEIGKQQSLAKEIRQTQILWFDPLKPTPTQNLFMEKVRALMQEIKQFSFLPIRDFECHYSIYPIGGYYGRHVDQFKGDSKRLISFILYLDSNWETEDGGELLLYDKVYSNKVEARILPERGKLVIFRSESQEHEVLPTKRKRHSITGWMRSI